MRGVPKDKLARALGVSLEMLHRRRTLLDGISADVAEFLKDKSVNPKTFEILRKMKPVRQLEVADLMALAGNFSATYASALLARISHTTDAIRTREVAFFLRFDAGASVPMAPRALEVDWSLVRSP